MQAARFDRQRNNGLNFSILTANSDNPFKKRIASIDIIKGIAMVMVILVHYNQSFRVANIPLFRFCQMGCQVFFVASGFGIAISYINKIKYNTVRKATKDFYISRIEAIAPAWWIMMAVVYIINSVVIKISGHTLSFGSNRSLIGIICNALFLQGLVPFCNNNVMPGGWYIGTTMILYAFSPIIVFLFSKYPPVKVCVFTSVLSILSVMGLTYVAYRINPQYVSIAVSNNSFGYFSFLTQYPAFSMGVLLYYSSRYNKRGSSVAEFIIGCILMIGSALLFFNPFFLFSYTFCASLVGLSSYFILKAMIAFENKGIILKGIVAKLMILFGRDSLFVFLVHAFFAWPFVSVVKKVLSIVGVNGDSYIVFVLLFPVVLFLSYFSGIILKRAVNYLVSKAWTTQ